MVSMGFMDPGGLDTGRLEGGTLDKRTKPIGGTKPITW